MLDTVKLFAIGVALGIGESSGSLERRRRGLSSAPACSGLRRARV